MLQRQAADGNAVMGKHAGHQLRQPGQRHGIDLVMTGADIGMGERGIDPEERLAGIADVACHHIFGRRRGGGIGSYFPIEGDDAPVRKMLAQMVVGAAIAEAEFEHRPLHLFHKIDDGIENIALSRQSANEAIEAAHLILSVIKYVSGATISMRCKSIARNANCRCGGNTGL